MRTGCSYMGHHNPNHMRTDLDEMRSLGCDDVLLAAQENDFVHMTGKIEFLPPLAREFGMRPLIIFWGVLNLFGGGRSSQFLLSHPECHQVREDGAWHPAGCYNNPDCVQHIQEMIDRAAGLGFEGYFIDEPTPLQCFCASCKALFAEWYGGELSKADSQKNSEFRRRCVIRYIQTIGDYVKRNHPRMETICCIMPRDREIWAEAAQISTLDNLGTDLYWVNNDRDVEEMRPILRELDALCKQHGKRHHEWLQAWKVKRGREGRILDQGRVLISERPDAIYVWAYRAQIGTTESSEDPDAAWERAAQVLREAKEI